MATAAPDDWAIARRRSLILSGKKDGKPYVREDFSECLVAILEGPLKSHVAAFGPLARNSEWCLALKTDAAKDRVLSAGTLKVRGVNFYVRSADRTQFPARVHWAPSYIPDVAITRVLSQYCKVQSIGAETSTAKGFEGIPTGIRRLVLSGDKDEIPHTFQIRNPVTEEMYELLIVIPGRAALCFKCKMTGHHRNECFTPFCRECSIFGHTTESCAIANSYSKALRGPAAGRDTSTAEASIDEDARYAYRAGGVEVVGGDLAQTVVSGVSGPGDPVTRSVMPMRAAAAVEARCDAPAAVGVDPVTQPASPPPPPPSASMRAAGDSEVDASAGVGECSSSPMEVESTQTEKVSTPSISGDSDAVAESVPPSTPDSEVIDMTTDSGDEGSTWATVRRKRKLNFSVHVAPPLYESPPLGRLQIVEASPMGKLIPKKMCLSDSGADSD